MIRVDHAGEYGAKRIYEGQLAILRGRAQSAGIIEEMHAQECTHLDAFDAMLRARQQRPTLLLPLWHVGGFVLGAATAMLGEKAAMACTVAVESVIDAHYGDQEEKLEEGDENGLKKTLTQFRAEELEHHDMALAHGAEEARAYPVLHATVSAITRSAIWLSTRV